MQINTNKAKTKYQPKSKMQNQLKEFLKSFKPEFTHLYIILYDLLFYVIITPILYLSNFIIQKQMETLPLDLLEPNLISAEKETIQAVASQVQSFALLLLGIIIAVFLIGLLAWSLSRGLIYTKILKKQLNKNYFLKFTGLNLLFAIITFVILLFFGSLLRISPNSIYLIYAVTIILVYFTSLIYIAFTNKNEVFSSIGKALTIGIKKLSRLILPCILILAIFIIISVIVNLFTVNPFISLSIFVIFLAWARLYFIPIANKLI